MARGRRSQAEKPNTIGTHGDDVLNGGNGDSYLHAKSGNDTLHGNGGDDVISGGNGNDLLWGGLGNDSFYFERSTRGHDTIFDWNAGDVIDLQQRSVYTVAQVGDDVQITLNGGKAIIDILGVNIEDVPIV